MLAIWLGLVDPAQACGGFFCDRGTPNPPVQAAERILFAVADGQVTMHVQIAYAGSSDHFAWIVPVAQQPDLFLSSDLLFNGVRAGTVPTFTVTRQPRNCDRGCGFCPACKQDASLSADTGFAYDQDSTPTVQVVDRATIGPYETVTLQANDAGWDPLESTCRHASLSIL